MYAAALREGEPSALAIPSDGLASAYPDAKPSTADTSSQAIQGIPIPSGRPGSASPTQPQRMPGIHTSPTSSTFAFQAPHPFPAGHSSSHSNEPFELGRRRSSITTTATSSGFPPRTGSSSGPRPFTAFTNNRPSTSATSVSLNTSLSNALLPLGQPADYACVKNLVGALTTNAYRLKAPGDAVEGIWFVFHDLR